MLLFGQARAQNVLHNAMNRHGLRFTVPADHAVIRQQRQRIEQVEVAAVRFSRLKQADRFTPDCLSLVAIEHELRDRIGRQPGQQTQEDDLAGAELGDRRLPGDGDTARILHAALIVPALYRGNMSAPVAQIGGQALPALLDVGAGLFQRQRQPVELARQLGRVGRVADLLAAFRLRALQQELAGLQRIEHVKLQRLHAGCSTALDGS